MKNSAWAIILLLIMLPKWGLGNDNSHADSFSEYINSPANTSDNSSDNSISVAINKDIEPMPVAENKPLNNPDKSDAKPTLQGIPYKWKTCANDSDCTAAAVDCVNWEAVNKKYLKKISQDLYSCSDAIDPGFQPQSICTIKKCQTTDKNTNISWEEWLGQMHKLQEK